MSDKIYCGSGKKQNDRWFKVTINPDKIKDQIEEFNGNKFIKLNINVKDEPDQYGKDISISVDTWKPDNVSEPLTSNDNRQEAHTQEVDDLPF